MTLDAGNVLVAKTGAVYVAPLGTTLPATSSASLDGAFVDAGYISEDGVTFTPNENNDRIRAWQNNAAVRTVFTELEYAFQFVMIEDKGAVAKLWYRSASIDVEGAGEWSLTPDTATTNIFSWVVDVIDGSRLKRYVIARGEITERGEKVFSNAEAEGYDATVTCYFDETLGAPFKAYSSSAAWGYS